MITTDATPFPLPPPLPAAPATSAEATRPLETPRRIAGTTLRIGLGAGLGALVTDALAWTPGGVAGGYGLALALVAWAAIPPLVRTDLTRREAMGFGVLLLGIALAAAWSGDGLCPLLALIVVVALLRRPLPAMPAAPPEAAPSGWMDALVTRLFRRLPGGARLRGEAGPVFVGLATTVVFLALLALGNAALAHHLGEAGAWVREHCRFIDIDWLLRPLLWAAGVLSVGVLTLARPAAKAGAAAPVARPGGSSRATVALLAGMNAAFLLSNTADAVWLWWRRAAPDGVSTTRYLYEGGWALLTVTAVAGVVLLMVFRRAGVARGSVAARRLAEALLAQCVFIGAGVGLRLGLQSDKFGFTPTRMAGFVAIAYGVVGVWWLARHLRDNSGVRGFLRRMAATAFMFLYCIQFYDTRVASTDLNLACWRARPEWRFSPGDYARMGPEGVRLWLDRRTAGAPDPSHDEPYGVDERVATEAFASPATPAGWREDSLRSAHLREVAVAARAKGGV